MVFVRGKRGYILSGQDGGGGLCKRGGYIYYWDRHRGA